MKFLLQGESYYPAPWWSHFAHSQPTGEEDGGGGEEGEDTEESSEDSDEDRGQEEEKGEEREEGEEDEEGEEGTEESQRSEDALDQRFKTDTLQIIEDVLSKMAPTGDESTNDGDIIDESEGDPCASESREVEVISALDESEESPEDESNVDKYVEAAEEECKDDDEIVPVEDSTDEGISSDNSCSEEVPDDERSGTKLLSEEEFSERSEGFFESVSQDNSEEFDTAEICLERGAVNYELFVKRNKKRVNQNDGLVLDNDSQNAVANKRKAPILMVTKIFLK